jgi:Uma2 family endonuclease
MNAVAKSNYTPETLLAMPDGDTYELVDGELVERRIGFRSSRVGGRLFRLLDVHCDRAQLGWVLPSDAGYQCFADDPQKVRKPDVSFIRADRLSARDEPEGWATIAPDFVAEVISPSELFEAVAIKVNEYLMAGVRVVWVIDTATRKVYVYRQEGRGDILTDTDELSGEEIVNGFRCRVADLFTPPAGVV